MELLCGNLSMAAGISEHLDQVDALSGGTLTEEYHSNATGSELNRAEVRYRAFYYAAQSITGLICFPIICFFGLSGNLLSILVLSQRRMRTPTNIYLTSLAISDSIKLLNDVIYFVSTLLLKIDPPTGSKVLGTLYPFAHYFFNMSVCCTAWITVGVAAERYMLVCRPVQARRLCNFKSARIVCSTTFLLTALLTLPLGFRYEYQPVSCSDPDLMCVEVTDFWRHTIFSTAYTWIHNSLRTLVPLVTVATMNYFIIRALRESSTRTGTQRTSMHRITVMLISVIVLFVVCVTPDAVMSTIFGYGYVEANYLVRGIREITDLLLLINSAANFVLYCTFNYVFRKNFVALFCRFKETSSPVPQDFTAAPYSGSRNKPREFYRQEMLAIHAALLQMGPRELEVFVSRDSRLSNNGVAERPKLQVIEEAGSEADSLLRSEGVHGNGTLVSYRKNEDVPQTLLNRDSHCCVSCDDLGKIRVELHDDNECMIKSFLDYYEHYDSPYTQHKINILKAARLKRGLAKSLSLPQDQLAIQVGKVNCIRDGDSIHRLKCEVEDNGTNCTYKETGDTNGTVWIHDTHMRSKFETKSTNVTSLATNELNGTNDINGSIGTNGTN